MSENYNRNLRLAMGTCQQLKDLAVRGKDDCNDDSCTTMWSSLGADMDKYITVIETEIDGHKAKNKWD